MKLFQSCPCGAEISVEYAPHAINTRDDERRAERSEARKLIDQWRGAHRPCLKRLDDPARSNTGNVIEVGPALDEHDDETERRLIVRIQNEGLLRDGLTVTDVRSALDA